MEKELYSQLVNGSFRGIFHSATHKALERGLSDITFGKILEVGAGSGEHYYFVKCKFDSYLLSDIHEDFLGNLADFKNTRYLQEDVQQLSFDIDIFDRVIVTCLLHHLENPIRALSEIHRVTKPGGVISILVPSDPGALFRLLRSLTSDRFLRKNGCINVKLLRATDHRNHASSLLELVKNEFQEDDIKIRTYPIDKLSWNFSLFKIIQIRLEN